MPKEYLRALHQTGVLSYSGPNEVVLGKVMALELGHLLLGPGHSDNGVMRAQFDDHDVGRGRAMTLVFLPAQREHLRAALAAGRTPISAAR